MNEHFFYKYAKEIKALFAKHHVSRCQIERSGLYASLYLDLGADSPVAARREYYLKEDLRDLALEKKEVVNINYLSYKSAEGTYDLNPPVDFDFFLSEGMVRLAMRGNKPILESLLPVVNINYQEVSLQQTALHFALRFFVRSRKSFDRDNADCEQYTLIQMQEVNEVIQLLIHSPEIDLTIQDVDGKTIAKVAVEDLPSKQSLKPIHNENVAKAEAMIGEVFLMLQNKGLEFDIEEIERKGYPLIANLLNDAKQVKNVEENNPTLSKRPVSDNIINYGIYSQRNASASTVISDNHQLEQKTQTLQKLFEEDPSIEILELFAKCYMEKHHCNRATFINLVKEVVESRATTPVSSQM